MLRDPENAAEFRARARRYRELAGVIGALEISTTLLQWADQDEAAAELLQPEVSVSAA